MQSLKEYLFESGILEYGTLEQIREASEEYKKLYQAQYRREFRKNHKRIEFSLTPEDYGRLKLAAKRHSHKIAPFIRKCSFAYLDKVFILPDKGTLRDLQLAIRRIGNNVNQLVKYVHIKGGISIEQIEEFNNHLNSLEDEITKRLCQPPDLLRILSEKLADNPALVIQNQRLLQQHKCTERDHQIPKVET